jgi:hypothetical protein
MTATRQAKFPAISMWQNTYVELNNFKRLQQDKAQALVYA